MVHLVGFHYKNKRNNKGLFWVTVRMTSLIRPTIWCLDGTRGGFLQRPSQTHSCCAGGNDLHNCKTHDMYVKSYIFVAFYQS